MAAAERIERGYLGSLLRLTLLAPDVVEAILDGREPDGLALPGLLRPIPSAWDEQRATLEGRDSRSTAAINRGRHKPAARYSGHAAYRAATLSSTFRKSERFTGSECGVHVENPVPADGPARIPAARASPAGFMGNAGSGR